MEVPELKAGFDSIVPYSDFIFGNEQEFLAFTKAENWKMTDLAQIATKIAKLPKVNKKRKRTVIVTQVKTTVYLAENILFSNARGR